MNAEKSTLVGVLRDLDQRFGLNRVMVVGDRGMVSPPHLDFLSGTPFRYLLGIPGRRCEEAATALEALDDEKWERVDEGNRVQEVSLSLPGAASGRYFVIESRERKSKERAGLALRTLVWHWGYNANTPWTPRPSRMTRAFSGL